MLRVSLLALLAAGGSLAALSTPALADCNLVGGFPSNTTVTCDGVSVLDGPDAVETRGIDDGSNDITIDILSGAVLDTTGGGERTIDLDDSEDSAIFNQGTILSGDEGIQAGERLRVENSGALEAVEKAIDANGDGVTVINSVTGRITSTTNEGIETGDNATITNFGTIEAFDDAIQVGEGALIDNHGIIRNTQLPADVEPNTSVEAQDAIDIDSGTIRNRAGASITSTTNAAIDFDPGTSNSVIENAGSISGTFAVTVDVDDTAGQEVINSGHLEGTAGVAVNLGKGADVVRLAASSTVLGDFHLGDDADVLVFEDAGYAGLGGVGLYDGGDGFDHVVFEDYTTASVLDVVASGAVLDIQLSDALGDLEVSLADFEQFVFGTGSDSEVLSRADLIGLVTQVPLPAGGWLLLAGLGALGLSRRRRG